MANQPEVSNFDAGVYQFETTDVVEGGPGGVDNKPLLNLANRTLWLKNALATETAARIAGDNALQEAINLIQTYVPRNVGWFAELNVGTGSGSLAVHGDITAATYVSSAGGTQVTVTMANAMPSTDYDVQPTFQSNGFGPIGDDDDVCVPAFRPISTTQFVMSFKETLSVDQHIRVHLKIFNVV